MWSGGTVTQVLCVHTICSSCPRVRPACHGLRSCPIRTCHQVLYHGLRCTRVHADDHGLGCGCFGVLLVMYSMHSSGLLSWPMEGARMCACYSSQGIIGIQECFGVLSGPIAIPWLIISLLESALFRLGIQKMSGFRPVFGLSGVGSSITSSSAIML